ncbi:uncharacterized protein LOC128606068 [Ictalurus furcatus]|uniref:uncharacterized protein LOC128606068 n=1 Tax=Ictalurus furcatus TaxID=66913 RepID=UPI002350CC5F|nr:uncharacterized protein LOC128606068 [Ictalurus furcatus]
MTASSAISPCAASRETDQRVESFGQDRQLHWHWASSTARCYKKGMVIVSPEMNPTICWMFEAEIVLLFHAKTFHKGIQVTVHVGNVTQMATVEALQGKNLNLDSPGKYNRVRRKRGPRRKKGTSLPQGIQRYGERRIGKSSAKKADPDVLQRDLRALQLDTLDVNRTEELILESNRLMEKCDRVLSALNQEAELEKLIARIGMTLKHISVT